ncbi:hypothetical protein V5P93_000487 [Actinokineospora auranticolor]|uniref:5-bromo-4-chloroindolyl phosphate hydrolysis protein n=1 Tax=Actinokineospora auranticolor TaxID=155976 RepID=A0A2S6GZF3_9PSEU|nr:hypothetical protein [Actinokineospora auranticolor]PPK70632.1 hypothetical protein CLV40_102550 [Actinokineospora auranticolor]
MATSNPVVRYFGSTKNLAGSALGLVGVVLHLAGAVGGLWPVVVVGLYLVGALGAPPEKVHLGVDPDAEASRLRADLNELVGKVKAASTRMPEGSVDRLERIAEVLRSMLDRPRALADDPESTHGATRLIRVDVPLAVETYLNLPWWFAVAKKVNSSTPSAAEELLTQLELLEKDAEAVSGRFFADDLRKQSDHTRYLRDRSDGHD